MKLYTHTHLSIGVACTVAIHDTRITKSALLCSAQRLHCAQSSTQRWPELHRRGGSSGWPILPWLCGDLLRTHSKWWGTVWMSRKVLLCVKVVAVWPQLTGKLYLPMEMWKSFVCETSEHCGVWAAISGLEVGRSGIYFGGGGGDVILLVKWQHLTERNKEVKVLLSYMFSNLVKTSWMFCFYLENC